MAPNAIGVKDFWKALSRGTNAIKKITSFDVSTYSSIAGAQIDNFSPADFIHDKGEIKRMGRSSHLGIAAAKLAVSDAGLGETSGRDLRVIIGSATSGLEYVEVDFRALERGGVNRVRPYLGIAGFGGAISSEISRELKIHGQSVTISTGCTAATDAMGFALDMIRQGKADCIITGGADACVTPGILAAFCQMGAVSTWKTNLERASRPFNKDRNGFVIGEGAWMFIFESLKSAVKRGAKIYAEVAGYGASCCAYHMAKPDPSGVYSVSAIEEALKDANLHKDQIDLFESYGNGTPLNDSYETSVVKKVFGNKSLSLMMPSIKSMIGHPLGASGAQQIAGGLMALVDGVVHPTINYEIPDPLCDLNYVPNNSVQKNIKAFISNSIAFGAKNSSLVFKKY